MPISKEERASQAAKHLSFVKGVFSKETDESVQSTIIYEDGEARSAQLPEPNADSTTTNVTTAFATSALHNASGKIALVDAASFTRPGGAYEDGSFGPEQVLCSESNLYPVLQGIKPLYHSYRHPRAKPHTCAGKPSIRARMRRQLSQSHYNITEHRSTSRD